MDLLQELQDLVTRYIDKAATLRDLEDGLADLAIPISEAGDPEAQALSSLVWRLLSEYGYRHRGEVSVRQSLQKALPVRRLELQGVPSRTLATGSLLPQMLMDFPAPYVATSVRLGAIA